MLDIPADHVAPSSGGLNRRDFIRVGAASLAGLSLADWFALKAHGQTKEGKAKSVIQLWMGGGPATIDIFDPKPQAGAEYTGPYTKPIDTNVKGIQLAQTMPQMAKQMDKYAILRGMTHPTNGHETATYIMQTGTLPSDQLVYPSIGAVVGLKRTESKAYQGALPPYIAVTSPLGRFSEAGFLGPAYKAFATGGNPNSKNFSIGGLDSGPERVARTNQRRSLLEAVDTLAKEIDDNHSLDAMDAYQEKAYELVLGDAKKAFDMNEEPDPVRDRYGRTTFGQSCLLARRLVEQGVPFMTVNWGGWDTHKEHFERMEKYLPELDQGFAALLEDLAQRGLLETTIVTWFGEFGRTPKIAKEPPWFGGRHHFCNAFSAIVAGGGFKGGAVVGKTDARAEQVIERPIYPWDLSASMYQLLGIDPSGQLPHPRGCVAYVTPVVGGDVATGGLLTEIM
ncbi:MAG: DUF1501 domain-containing protein [Planctomycetes bacterium]|nr:DUF1501 domain-containing protein [Planctomycetota bacterium]